MAVHFGVAGVRQLITGVRLGVIEFPAPMACSLNRLFMRIAAANEEGDTLFDVKVNDVSIYGSPMLRPKILITETIHESFPSVALIEGDMVTVDVVAAPLGGISGLYVIVQLQDAPSVEQYVISAYQGAYARDPDGTELSNAVADLTSACDSSTTLAATKVFLDDLFTDTEYTTLSTTDAEYIEDLYNAVLGRRSDPSGFSFWVGRLGTLTRAEVRDNFNGCDEHVNLRVAPWCPQTKTRTNAVAIQNVEVDDTTPTTSQILAIVAGKWTPVTPDYLIFDFKNSVRAASTANVNIASAPSSIDGVSLASGDRVLLKNQSTGSQNGIRVFTSAGAALARATDMDSSAKATAGMFVTVNEGTINADTIWWLTSNDPIVLDTTSLTYTQFGASGGSLPTGGSMGQVLTKLSGTDGDADWISPPAPPRPTSTDTPAGEADLELWLRADLAGLVPPADGKAFFDWLDLSGKTRDAKLFIAGLPTFVGDHFPLYEATSGPNSQPSISFPANSNSVMQLPGFLDNAWTGFEAFLIIKMPNEGTAQTFTRAGSGSGGLFMASWGTAVDVDVFYSDGHWYDSTGQATRYDTGDPAAAMTSWRCIQYSIVPSTTNGWQMMIDNTLHFQTNSSAFVWPNAPQLVNSRAVNGFSGRVAEFMVFSSIGHRAALVSYLNARYSFSLT